MATQTTQDKHIVDEVNKIKRLVNSLSNEVYLENDINIKAWSGGNFENRYKTFLKNAIQLVDKLNRLKF